MKDVLEFLKESIMNSKGMALLAILCGIGILFSVCVGGAILAKKYLSPEEAAIVESDLENIAETEVEELFHEPAGTLKPEMDEIFLKKE